MPEKKPRVLVIGLDAATMELVEPWARSGKLPVLASLMREGSSTTLLSTPNMHSASSWTSILTGVNPGRHGLFVFSDRDFKTGEQVFFKGGDRSAELISAHLAGQGLSSGFLNVPMTYPAEAEPGGFMISGLDAPSLNENSFAPRELRRELLDRFPRYRFSPDGLGDLMRAGRLEEASSEWLQLIETQTQAAEYLLDSKPVDFFMTVYTASDWAGHNLWQFADRSESPLLEIYQALDQAVGRLVRRSDEGGQVYVISDHGMGRHTGASYHLADWLEKKGFLARTNRSQSLSMLGAARRAARTILPESVRERVKTRLGESRIEKLRAVDKDAFYSSIDWEHSTAYTEPGRHVININLAGRNPEGVVKQEDYDRVCASITEALAEWRDESGKKVISRVDRRDSAYWGKFVERASDLYIHWNHEADLGEPPEEVRDRGFWWSGDHRPEGILICKGSGISANARIELARVYDLVPTIMYGAGLRVPAGLDGRVIDEAFTAEFRARHSLTIVAKTEKSESSSVELTSDEQTMIEEKLRGLGYL